MIRILGNNLQNTKQIVIALTNIYGIGFFRSKLILNLLNINFNKKVNELTNEEIKNLSSLLESEKFKLEGNLKKEIKTNINKLIQIQSFRGKRHLKGLPCHGQRTRTNSKTAYHMFIKNNNKILNYDKTKKNH